MKKNTDTPPKYRTVEQAVHLELLEPLGEQVRALRKSRRLTQPEVGDRMQKSASVIGKYERGAVNIRIGTLAQLAQALDCRLEIILTPFEHLDA